MTQKPASAEEITILLTLKGRHLHTLRWLWHANRIRLPYRIFIADGDVHPTIARILKDGKLFPELRYEYHEYKDSQLIDYYRKCDDAVGKITTPYVMMCDNDDFLFLSGVNENWKFLNENQSYVVAQGAVPGFELSRSQLTGKISNLFLKNADAYTDYAENSAQERAKSLLKTYHPIFYGLYRTQELKKITKEIVEIQFTSLQLHELFWALRAVSLGKARSSKDYFFYLRQKGTTSNASIKKDFVFYLMRTNFTDELQTVIKKISNQSEPGEDYLSLREEFAGYFRRQMKNTYGKKSKFAGYARKAVAKMKVTSLHKNLFSQIEWKSGEFLKTQTHELEEIERSLNDSALVRFLKDHAKDFEVAQ